MMAAGASEILTFEKICLRAKIYDVNNVGTLKMAPSGVAWRSADKTENVMVQASDMLSATWRKAANGYEMRFTKSDGGFIKWDGFQQEDMDRIKQYAEDNFKIEVKVTDPAVKGFNWGDLELHSDNVVVFTVDGRTAFEIPVQEVLQTDKDQRKTEVSLMFAAPPGNPKHETLDSIRFFFQKDTAAEEEGGEEEGEEGEEAEDAENKPPVETRAEKLYNRISKLTNKDNLATSAVATFQEVSCRVPRGRYTVRLFEDSVTFHGPKNTYSIPYTQIQKLFLLDKADGASVYFAVYVDPPVRQGQTSYPFFVMEIMQDDEVESLELKISDEDLAEKYNGELEKNMSGPVYRVMSKVLRKLSGKSLGVPSDDFVSARDGSNCCSCALKNEQGLLYPLKNAFLYMFKPPLYVKYSDVRTVTFDRQAGATSKNFRMTLTLKAGIEHSFSNIPSEEYTRLLSFLRDKNMRVEEMEQASYGTYMDDGDRRGGEKDHYLERVKGEAGSESESEDEDFNPDAASGGSDVAEEFDSEVSDDSDDDSEEGSGGSGDEDRKRKKKQKEKPAKKPRKEKSEKPKKSKKSKKKKDPNEPKKPLSGFMQFSQDMREKVKEENPDLEFKDIGRKLGEMWKELGEDGQKRYKDQYDNAVVQWKKDMAEYKKNNPSASEDEEEASPKKAKKTSSAPKASAKVKQDNTKYQSAEYIEDSDDEL